MKRTSGKITIGRLWSSDINRQNTIRIEIEDKDGKLVTVVEMKPEDFAKAITGLACQDCDIEN